MNCYNTHRIYHILKFFSLFCISGLFLLGLKLYSKEPEKEIIAPRKVISANSYYNGYSLLDKQEFHKLRFNKTFLKENKLISNLYTMVIPTFHRDKLIKKAINHYSQFSNVSKIIVVWFNEKKLPNSEEIEEYINSKSKVPLEFYWMPNAVRHRYFPFPSIKTEAVLNVDDDILIEEKSVKKAFNYWKVTI